MSAASQTMTDDMKKAAEAVRQSQKELVDIERTRDIEKALTYFTDDVIIQLQDQPQAKGIPAMRAIYQQFLTMDWKEMIIESTDTEVSSSCDFAVDLGWMVFKFDKESGHPPVMRAKYLSVLRKINGKWKIVANNVTMDEKY